MRRYFECVVNDAVSFEAVSTLFIYFHDQWLSLISDK